MDGTFLDSTIFLRHILNDVPAQSEACRQLLHAVEAGTVTAWTSSLVLAEIVFVLSNPKTYAVARTMIRDAVLPLINLPNLKIEHKRLYSRVFDLYTSLSIDYVDAYHAALLELYGQGTLYSFDTDFDKIGGIERQEPSAT